MKQLIALFFSFLLVNANAQVFENFTTADGLIDNAVNCLSIESVEKIWFGTQSGFSLYSNGLWTNFDQDSNPELLSNTIKAILGTKDEELWIGTDFGLNHFDGQVLTAYTEADGLGDNKIKCLTQQSDGKLWIGHSDGASVFDRLSNTWTNYGANEGLPFGGVNAIEIDANGIVWMGTGLGGVAMFVDGGFEFITKDDGLLSNKIRSIAFDNKNKAWIATSDGVSVLFLDGTVATNHEFLFDLPAPHTLNPIEDVVIDKGGCVWAGVYIDYLVGEGGMSHFDGDQWQQFEMEDGLIGPVIQQLDIDEEDNIWIATSTGISKLYGLDCDFVPTSTLATPKGIKLHLYPNPAKDNITLQSENKLNINSMRLFNMQMQRIPFNVEQVSMNQLQLNVSMLPKGAYILNVENAWEKIVIE